MASEITSILGAMLLDMVLAWRLWCRHYSRTGNAGATRCRTSIEPP
jgi:hypothetical protein